MGSPFTAATLIVVVVLLLMLLSMSLRIAKQYERAVVFRLGKYSRTSGPGVYFLLPLIEWQTVKRWIFPAQPLRNRFSTARASLTAP